MNLQILFLHFAFTFQYSYSKMIPNWEDIYLSQQNSLQCQEPLSFYNQLPHKFEPSDIIYNAYSKRLFIVSDNGVLVSMDVDGRIDQIWEIPGKPDLEALTFIPHSHKDILYLGQEYPASVLEFNMSSKAIQRTFDVQSYLDDVPSSHGKKKKKPTNKGLESLVYLPNTRFNSQNENHNQTLGYFIVGRQSDARLFFFEISKGDSELSFKGTMIPPGPGKDLSSMTLWRDHLWLLYDKDMSMNAMNMSSHSLDLMNSKIPFALDSSDSTLQEIGIMNFHTRGQEGIAFVETADSQGKDGWVFICVDPPKHQGKKDLLRYSLTSFFSCFSSLKNVPFQL